MSQLGCCVAKLTAVLSVLLEFLIALVHLMIQDWIINKMPTLDTPVSSLMPTGSRQWIPNRFSAPVSNKDFSTVITTSWYCWVWLFGCSARCYFSFLLGYSHCYSNASLTARLPLFQRVFTANSPFLTTGLLLFYAEGVWHHSPALAKSSSV